MKNAIFVTALLTLSAVSSSAFAADDSYGRFTIGSSVSDKEDTGFVFAYDLDTDLNLGGLSFSADRVKLDGGFGNAGSLMVHLSGAKLFDLKDQSFDVRLAGGMDATYTEANGHNVAYLFGPQIVFSPFNSNGADVTMEIHGYVRDDINVEGDATQFGGSLDASFKAVGNKFVVNGEVDYINVEGEEGDYVRSKVFAGFDMVYLFSGRKSTGGHVDLGFGHDRNVIEEGQSVTWFGIQAGF